MKLLGTSPVFDRWRARFEQQATPRALIGVALLMILATYFLVDSLAGLVQTQRTENDNLRRELAIQQSLLSDSEWIARAEATRVALEAAQDRFWKGDTPGIVIAEIQGAVETAARNAGLTQPRVTVVPSPEPMSSDAVLFDISVTARDGQGQFLSFFQSLIRSENLLVPKRLHWRQANGALDIRLVAPAIISPEERYTDASTP